MWYLFEVVSNERIILLPNEGDYKIKSWHWPYTLFVVSILAMLFCKFYLFAHNIMGKIYSTAVYKVCEDGRGPKQMIVLGLVASNCFMSLQNFHINPTIPHSSLTR
jgi:hypothetical protein